MKCIEYSNHYAANTQNSELHATADILERSCDSYCQSKIKDAEGCSIFCSFLDHVKKHDLHDIYLLYEQANWNPKPLVFILFIIILLLYIFLLLIHYYFIYIIYIYIF